MCHLEFSRHTLSIYHLYFNPRNIIVDNVLYKRAGHISERAISLTFRDALPINTIAQPTMAQSSYNEGDVSLAISAINRNQIQSERQVVQTYNVPRTTVQRRRAGIVARRDCEPNSRKLTKLEEEVITAHILDLDSRGFPPTLDTVRDMANKLLAERGAGEVGKLWPRNFVKRTGGLTTRFNRPYDRQRALCEDPEAIKAWFDLVARTKAKYGICDEDTWNFDKAGFLMGKISAQLVVTGSERRGRPKSIQSGNREWVTVIQGISAAGWAIPPFVIFAGQYHLSAWYEGDDIPGDWAISLSDNGWTTNELGVDWLKHFVKHTKERRVGAYQLLIIDGHESHRSLEFQKLCKENNIITLFMPPHSSHLLQPLDVGCFSPLKRAYSRQIESLVRDHINYITKLEFLPAFRAAYNQSITKENIYASFRGAGLAPHNPEVVTSKLDVKLRTPTPPAPEVTLWEAETPSNAHELEAQSTLIRNRVRRHKSSSPASIITAINQLEKGAELMLHTTALLKGRVTSLERANEAATTRKQRKKKRIQRKGTLSKAEGQDIITQKEVEQQVERETRQGKAQSSGSQQAVRRCTRCKETGHNSRTCKKDTVDTL